MNSLIYIQQWTPRIQIKHHFLTPAASPLLKIFVWQSSFNSIRCQELASHEMQWKISKWRRMRIEFAKSFAINAATTMLHLSNDVYRTVTVRQILSTTSCLASWWDRFSLSYALLELIFLLVRPEWDCFIVHYSWSNGWLLCINVSRATLFTSYNNLTSSQTWIDLFALSFDRRDKLVSRSMKWLSSTSLFVCANLSFFFDPL